MRKKKSGKRVFLLYPPAVIQDELLDFLIMAGFEAYILRDHERARKILHHFPGSIMFIDIDEGLTEPEWETYIKNIKGNPEYRCELGILSSNKDPDLMRKYLMELGVPGGYVHLKNQIMESTRIMFNVLDANESHGIRRFTRVSCEKDPLTAVTVKNGQESYRGKLLVISAAGITARFEQFTEFPGNTIKDIELTLRDHVITTDALNEEKRRANEWIFTFDPSRMDKEKSVIIHAYIKIALQEHLDKLKL